MPVLVAALVSASPALAQRFTSPLLSALLGHLHRERYHCFLLRWKFFAPRFRLCRPQNFGIVIFRWAAVASVIVSLASVSYAHKGILIIPEIALGLMRSVSVLELCLLAFLCISMNALQVVGARPGFWDCTRFRNALGQRLYLGPAVSGIGPSPIRCSLCTRRDPDSPWRCGFPTSSCQSRSGNRWWFRPTRRSIAGTRLRRHSAIREPRSPSYGRASSFFLTDVEKVVDKVLTRNLHESESKS